MAFAHEVIEDRSGDSTRTHKLSELTNTPVTLETGDHDLVGIVMKTTTPTEDAYLKLFNSGDVTVATDEPDMVLPIPTSASWYRSLISQNGGIVRNIFTAATTVLLTATKQNATAQSAVTSAAQYEFYISTKPGS